MKYYTIVWKGTITGETYVEADSLEEAIDFAKECDSPIEEIEYPNDWEVDVEATNDLNKIDLTLTEEDIKIIKTYLSMDIGHKDECRSLSEKIERALKNL